MGASGIWAGFLGRRMRRHQPGPFWKGFVRRELEQVQRDATVGAPRWEFPLRFPG